MRRYRTKNKMEKEWAFSLLDKEQSANMNTNLKQRLKEAAQKEAKEVEKRRGTNKSLDDEKAAELAKL